MIDFRTLGEETRRRLQNSRQKGQSLGNSRKQGQEAHKAKRTTQK
ncbi:hypothetical protein [Deinococcus hopiensis]|nr:hypothetical protein [Deinococcus hopiensis]